MSEGASFWVILSEKFFGLILVIVGVLAIYYTFTSADILGVFTGFFGFLSTLLLILGLFIIIAKAE